MENQHRKITGYRELSQDRQDRLSDSFDGSHASRREADVLLTEPYLGALPASVGFFT